MPLLPLINVCKNLVLVGCLNQSILRLRFSQIHLAIVIFGFGIRPNKPLTPTIRDERGILLQENLLGLLFFDWLQIYGSARRKLLSVFLVIVLVVRLFDFDTA